MEPTQPTRESPKLPRYRGGVPRSCSSTCAGMWYDTQAAGRVTTHLGIQGEGIVGWQAGQVGR